MRLLATLLLLPTLLHAQDFDFYARGPYRQQVPHPDAILGYAVGSQQTMYYQQQQVLDRLIEAAPDRVRTEIIGKTAEGKVMRLLIISAPAKIARLDEIRGSLALLADPRKTSVDQARALAEKTPVTVLLTHSVHGNEPAGFEAAMQTVYQLLASDEPATLEILQNTVVLINPSQNPDGHERFAAWSNSVAVGSDDPLAVEQTEPWAIWGRYNHYRFDMNRDLLAQSQNESKAIASVYVRWHPQVVADLHSTTSQYFFPPVADAHNANLPAKTYAWFERFGRNNGQAFDRFGWQYYVRDVFDFFYPGYIDMWPTMRGGVGMTFETDGGPELKKRKDDGTWVTFEMAIAHHYTASLATLEYAAKNRTERLRDFYDFHATGMSDAQKRPMRRVLFSAADPGRAMWLARRLAGEEIEVGRLTQAYAPLRATSYFGGPVAAKRSFPAGTYVVDLAQPEARLATTMLEPRAAWDSAFVRRQYGSFQRNQRRGADQEKESYEFYDITAWSLPLTLGLDAWWTDDTARVANERIRSTDSLAAAPAPARAQSAYLFSNESEAGTRLAMRLLREGFHVSVATRPITADATPQPRGTFVVRLQRNPATIHERIVALARETGARVTAVRSAFPDSGQFGIGSETVVAVRAPRILLAAGDGVDQTAFGAVWFYFDRELGIPVTPVNLSTIGDANLEDYNVLIIPSGYAGTLWRELGERGAANLRSWVESGGAVIGFGGSVELLGRKEVGLTTVKELVGDSVAVKDTTITDLTRPAPPLVSPSAAGGNTPEEVPGAIFRATLDRTHWLTAGYERDQLPVFLETSRFLKPSEKGANPVVFTGSDLTLAGFTWPNNTEKLLRNSVWAAVETVGSGSVVVFAENPVYRGFWRGPAKLLTNAVLFAPGR
ncbi:MAG: M14 family metallopeptidase [Gemmatimonadota bacterium]